MIIFSRLIALIPGLMTGFASAEIRLLTGDANNQLHGGAGNIVDISEDGDWVLFVTGPPVQGSTPGISNGGVYLRQLSTDTLSYVGGNTGLYIGAADGAVSASGRYVTWRSTTKNFQESAPNPAHIYWCDRTAGITRLITADAEKPCVAPQISGDGRYVTFASAARNLPVASNTLSTETNRLSVYRYDSENGELEIISLAPNGSALDQGVGQTAASNCYDLSADGQYVVYSSSSTNAHSDTSLMAPGFFAVYRRNLVTGEIDLLNRNSSGAVVQGNFTNPRVNSDGSRTAFIGSFVYQPPLMSSSVPASFGNELYVKDSIRDTGQVWWASETATGVAHDTAFGLSLSISAAGDAVAFSSFSNLLTDEDSDAGGGHRGTEDAFRSDLEASGAVTITLISKSPTNSGNVSCRIGPFMAGTGDYVAFSTDQLGPILGTPWSPYQGIGVGTFPAATGTGLSYEAWAAGIPPAERAYTDNPAQDGVNNLLKYMMGMDPAIHDRSQLPLVGVRSGSELGLTGDSETYLTLEVRIRRNLPAGFTWTVNAANDPTQLTANPGGAVQVGTPTPDGDFDRYLFRFPTPQFGAPGVGFMNVSFSGAP